MLEEILHTCLPRIRKGQGGRTQLCTRSETCALSSPSTSLSAFPTQDCFHHFPLHFSTLGASVRRVPSSSMLCKDPPHPSNPPCVPMKLSLIIPGRRELSFLDTLRRLTACLDYAQATYVHLFYVSWRSLIHL